MEPATAKPATAEPTTWAGNSLAYDVVESTLGWVGILVSPRGLRQTSLPEPSVEAAMSALGPEIGQATHDPRAVEPYAAKISAYLRGEAIDLTGPADGHEAGDQRPHVRP